MLINNHEPNFVPRGPPPAPGTTPHSERQSWLNSLFARGEEIGDPVDDRVRDVIHAQLSLVIEARKLS